MMRILNHIRIQSPCRLQLRGILLILVLFTMAQSKAQITIGGNVYGGGDMGNVGGNTSVRIISGNLGDSIASGPDNSDFGGSVFGGARMADVDGNAYVYIDGDSVGSAPYSVINRVYGGNDIAGTIKGLSKTVPLPDTIAAHALEEAGVDNTWNAFVFISNKKDNDNKDIKKIYIGQLFAGGNGNYDYTDDTKSYYGKDAPDLAKTYLHIGGGSIVYAYGGGNNATITEKTIIHVDNPSDVVNTVVQKKGNEDIELLNTKRFKAMGINTGFSKPSSDEFQIGRLFGGNNTDTMAIRPTWDLLAGSIRNLYSGGNRGDMTHNEGLLLEIKEESRIIVDNLYGGCRMANINPLNPDGTKSDIIQLSDPNYAFPAGLSARVLIKGGDINNVYGGNDVTGHVVGGDAVGIHTSIRGNVYGGGNGSYPYTDNEALIGDDIYGDLFYDVPNGKTSIQALNDFRPDAEQVSIHIYGYEYKPTVIGGSIYLGGNSATIKRGENATTNSKVELKVGSYVYADNVFLGNNGENMVTEEILGTIASKVKGTNSTDSTKFNSNDLTQSATFAQYMEGAAMDLIPTITFDYDESALDDSRKTYQPYTTYFGSLYLGGNRGSMDYSGVDSMNFNAKVIVFNKVVGGCNDANIAESKYNAAYKGGILGSTDEAISYINSEDNSIKDRLVMNFDGLRIQPMRWQDSVTTKGQDTTVLVWNTYYWDKTYTNPYNEEDHFKPFVVTNDNALPDSLRLFDGNIYGGCYTSGHVNGNVVININDDIIDRSNVFMAQDGPRNSGVILDEQSFDVNVVAMSAFGAGYGEDTEIWGSTNVNLNSGYILQIYGGGYQGIVGKIDDPDKDKYGARYSTVVNLNSASAVYSKDQNPAGLAEAEYLYGGGNEGDVYGNTYVYLGNGRIYDSFGGASDADVLGHTETYIGLNKDGQEGFPYVRDIVYGGNDFGGIIHDTADFNSRVSEFARDKVYDNTRLRRANAYIEYLQGRVDTIFGGGYGMYDYNDTVLYGHIEMPYLGGAFVNIRPKENKYNYVNAVFGAGTGFEHNRQGDKAQDRSYVLIDIPDHNNHNFRTMQIFGAGSYNGLGMAYSYDETTAQEFDLDTVSAVVDLIRGEVGAVYGGSFNEGVTRRTLVNVPEGSTINIGSIFGGAYGINPLFPCDVYESHVNWNSDLARLVSDTIKVSVHDSLVNIFQGAIFGGNNNNRQTVFSQVNINAPVNSKHYKYGNSTANVYGAGYGPKTWNRYTEVNLNNGARVYEVYGGGKDGIVINDTTVRKYMTQIDDTRREELGYKVSDSLWQVLWNNSWIFDTIGGYDQHLNIENPLAKKAEMDSLKHNTNVRINKGAYVNNYAYGGGYGSEAIVSGSTYIALLGGGVYKDLYAGGSSGAITDIHEAGFTPSANAYIQGGTVRNVYGGGWEGNVGTAHETDTRKDIRGEANVVIGVREELAADAGTPLDYYYGIPAIQRNAYAGGEGGSIIGTANITVNNGYIGYAYLNKNENFGSDGKVVKDSTITEPWYAEKIDDETSFDESGKWTGKDNLLEYGDVFGGGYDDVSSVDIANVTIYGGVIRNDVYGGGEISIIGRGSNTDGKGVKIHKAGQTHVTMYAGHVKRNVFGGGRGFNLLGYGGGHNLYTDGYVFGQTEVRIHGGVIGTEEGIATGNGNVFGGGNMGYVYSAYEHSDSTLRRGIKSGVRYDGGDEGSYFMSTSGGSIDSEKIMTEDCKVLIEPWLRVTAQNGISYKDSVYAKNSYIPTSYLNSLPAYDSGWTGGWSNVDAGTVTEVTQDSIHEELRGITIYNAVFAGGNALAGNQQNANVTTVFGNATATVHDIYHRDMISIGTGRVGGLYGDGNLTFVDGYRELNITNYGTDYWHIEENLDINSYKKLPTREKDYYELRYRCLQACTDNDGTTYSKGSTIPHEQLMVAFAGTEMIDSLTNKPNPLYWIENGVVSRYAGRIMNTIQRADFCGVFGSRMVMQGAQDRVPETVDNINYTINRVREVSLNGKVSTAGDSDDKNKLHGNYFGIYSVVNYLGALTSDVDFDTVRVTDNSDSIKYKIPIVIGGRTVKYGEEDYTYANWKKAHIKDKTRNNGTSHNQVALASGVYLELTTEESTGSSVNEKDWGPITGVIELDLINVSQGVGGGFIYAKNVHGVRSETGKKNITLASLNKDAISNKKFKYTKAVKNDEWESSGNFVHNTQTIIDDCYNIGGRYYSDALGHDSVPAHYWFIKGDIYIYDQYISAYTGASNTYTESQEIPLTLTAAAHGKIKLLDVKPNRYAYYANNSGTVLTNDSKLVINDVTYRLNDPISYWDWQNLSSAEQRLFVEQTYVVIEDCKIGNDEYNAGTVLNSEGYNALIDGGKPTNVTHKKLIDGHLEDVAVDFDFVFRSSNNLSHNTGYILTYNVNNPAQWDTVYSYLNGTNKLSNLEYNSKTETEKKNYIDGPTYTPQETGLYGQREYSTADIITKSVYDKYETAWNLLNETLKSSMPTQAKFGRAYITTQYVEVIDSSGVERHLQKGAKLARQEYKTEQWSALSDKVAEAWVVERTIKISDTEYITAGELMTEAERNALSARLTTLKNAAQHRIDSINGLDILQSEKDIRNKGDKKTIAQLNEAIQDVDGDEANGITSSIVPAYYCYSTTQENESQYYGGDYFVQGANYRGNVWSDMSRTDRNMFDFNYDALDLLIDSTYAKVKALGQKYQYDSQAATKEAAENSKAKYSLQTPVDYTATYEGNTAITYINDLGRDSTATTGMELTRTEFERLLNEQSHYAPINVTTAGKYYVANMDTMYNHQPFAIGQVIDKDTYLKFNPIEKSHVDSIDFTEIKMYYYCRESYTIAAEANDGKPVKGVINDTRTLTYEQEVPIGFIISQEGDGPEQNYAYGYKSLTNKQLNFSIHGTAPVETSTLFVSRNSDIYDLSKDKIITVIYQYDYKESDESGANITPVSERHVLNIHISFRSGIPTVSDISEPNLVLPGTGVTMRTPTVTPGAYEIISTGWELFEKDTYAVSHTNGVEYTPAVDPLYWYQDGYYIAYYAKTYLGKTYSNYVPVSVANYHDIKAVMEDNAHHMYVDNTHVKRNSKIYINDYSSPSKDGIELLKDMFDLSLITTAGENGIITADQGTAFTGHRLLNERVKGGKNLEFILHTDINHNGTWESIGDGNQCFEGTFHGDGYTINGLDHSLFGKLCGDVYNLGVTGSFTGAGIAETGDGYIENAWVSTTGQLDGNGYAVFGSPSGERVGRVQLVNSYYTDTLNYKTTTRGEGVATPMPAQSFYNGEVAYNLNSFYLNKRYYDGIGQNTGQDYKYIDTLKFDKDSLLTAYYPAIDDADRHVEYGDLGYVEERYMDGDFRFADGVIPSWTDRHERTDADGDPFYSPVWPDDYLFFGQRLTFGYNENGTHQNKPSHYESTNRVYRAPAYYGSSKDSTAYFNPNAVLAAHDRDNASINAFPGMTAIDFTGYHDASTYTQGTGSDGMFYGPRLDFNGLTGLRTDGQTQNLLAYVKESDEATMTVVEDYFAEPAYVDYTGTDDYESISKVPDLTVEQISGHLVKQLANGTFQAATDHLLVDKQDFNAPISYSMGSRNTDESHTIDNVMWYQRTPDTFVQDAGNGWESISLPFTSKIVTTSQKGIITHFYEGSNIGHEYWLRTPDRIDNDNASKVQVVFKSLAKATQAEKENKLGDDITYSNKFLWDYYYNNNKASDSNRRKDKNGDTYQEYYNKPIRYDNYPFLAATQPYLIGFPGVKYYEFDLSGEFEAQNTAQPAPAKLAPQTITFISDENVEIGVSDDDYRSTVEVGNYLFKPTYQSTVLDDTEASTWLLNDSGTVFRNYALDGSKLSTQPFRPYMAAKSSSHAQTRAATRSVNLYIGYSGDVDLLEERAADGGLLIYGENMNICVESTLDYPTQVTIVTLAGKQLKKFTIQPGTKVTVPVNNRGVYIVNRHKIAVAK